MQPQQAANAESKAEVVGATPPAHTCVCVRRSTWTTKAKRTWLRSSGSAWRCSRLPTRSLPARPSRRASRQGGW